MTSEPQHNNSYQSFAALKRDGRCATLSVCSPSAVPAKQQPVESVPVYVSQFY